MSRMENPSDFHEPLDCLWFTNWLSHWVLSFGRTSTLLGFFCTTLCCLSCPLRVLPKLPTLMCRPCSIPVELPRILLPSYDLRKRAKPSPDPHMQRHWVLAIISQVVLSWELLSSSCIG